VIENTWLRAIRQDLECIKTGHNLCVSGIFSIEKLNISIEKVIFSIKKLNIFIKKLNISIKIFKISIEKTNISIKKVIFFIKKMTFFSVFVVLFIEPAEGAHREKAHAGSIPRLGPIVLDLGLIGRKI